MNVTSQPTAGSLPDEETMWQTFLERDSQMEGIFFVAVKTTGIFCRPTCPARKPKRENIEFVASQKEALLRGFRPCKRCHPMEPPGAMPAYIKDLLRELNVANDVKISDADLRRRDLDPNRVRRWFKKHHGLTFQAYQRSLRISHAFGAIRHGEKVINAAYESGYESLSGFTDWFKQTTGFAPSQSKSRNIIHINRLLTPLGPMLVGATDEGICLLDFTDRRMLETLLKRLNRRMKASFIPGENPHFKHLEEQLKAYFNGELHEFEVPLVYAGSDFQTQVWDLLQTIPYGATRSYQEQAELMGNPKAVRAVARANGDNCLAILVPCHRVIGKDGHLTGYGGGLWRKQYLLDLERS